MYVRSPSDASPCNCSSFEYDSTSSSLPDFPVLMFDVRIVTNGAPSCGCSESVLEFEYPKMFLSVRLSLISKVVVFDAFTSRPS